MDKSSREIAYQAFRLIGEIVSAEGAEDVSDILTAMLDEHEDEDDSATCVLLHGMKDAMRSVTEMSDGLTASITVRASSTQQVHFCWDSAEPMTEHFHMLISRAVAGALER